MLKKLQTIKHENDSLDLLYYPEFYNIDDADEILDYLLSIEYNIPIKSMIKINNKIIPAPRRQSIFGDYNISHKMAKYKLDIKPWTKSLAIIRDEVLSFIDIIYKPIKLNLASINHYENGQKYIGWYSNNEPYLASVITILLSFGATRTLLFRNKLDRMLQYQILLNHGDILIMKGYTNKLWQLSLPKQLDIFDDNINIIFKIIEKNI